MGGLYTPTRFPPQIPKAKREAMPKFPDKRVEQFPIESWNDPVARSKKIEEMKTIGIHNPRAIAEMGPKIVEETIRFARTEGTQSGNQYAKKMYSEVFSEDMRKLFEKFGFVEGRRG